MFPLDSLLELPLTSSYFVPANLFPPEQLRLCDRDRSLTWPFLLCCLYIPSIRILASFPVLQLSAPQRPHRNQTGLCPILSEGCTEKYPEILSSMMKMVPGKRNQINSAADQFVPKTNLSISNHYQSDLF